MTDNEIKKALYRESPKAIFSYFRKGVLHYTAEIQNPLYYAFFAVPAEDTGDADFHREMEAKHLIRYLSNTPNNKTGNQ